MQPNELTTAKINATLKILEWSRDDIEPGIGGAPDKAYIAIAEAFRVTYRIIEEAIEGKPKAEAGEPDDASVVRIGGEELSS